MKFAAQFGVRVAEIITDAHHGLVERQAGLDADYGQVQSIGKSETNAALPFLQLPFQQEARDKKAERGYAKEQQRRTESAKYKD